MKTCPSLLARYDLGRTRPAVTPVVLPGGEGQVGLCIVAGALHCYDTSGQRLWACHPPGLNFTAIAASGDLDQDGAVEVALQAGRPADPYGAAVLVALDDGRVLWRYDVEPMSYCWYLHVGDYLPESHAQEIVVLMMGYPPDKRNGYITLFAFTEAGATQQWRYDFDQYTCYPSFLQSDLDGDGLEELVVETHSRMWFLDARTGQLEHFVKWDVSPANVRSYGLVEFVDLDHDGDEDFLCIANFAQHHEVLLNNHGRMERAWAHGWPESVTTGKVVSTWPQPPYVDLDGDGRCEIVVSMFNSENDAAWLIRAYDALTGTLKYRMPGMIAVAAADLDGDGKAELLADASDDPTQTTSSGARLLEVGDGRLEVVWRDDAAAAVRRGPAAYRGPAPGSVRFDELVIARNGAQYALHFDGGVTCRPWSPPVPEAPDFSAVPAVKGPAYPELLAADLTGDARNEIVLYQEPTATVLEYADDGIKPVGTYTSTCLPVIADLNGDAKAELVLSSVRPEAAPVVEALTPALDDKVLWRSQLPPPGRTGLPQQRKAYLRAGLFHGSDSSRYLTGKPTPDIYFLAGTPLVRSVMLDGLTGDVLWERGEAPGLSRYCAPTVNLAAVHDYDGDGAEDLVFTNPDYYCIASGPTGELLLGPLFPPHIFSQPSQGLYTYPAILTHGKGDPIVCLVAGHYFQGVMSIHAESRWYAVPVAGESRCAREGFLQLEDGAWLMGFGRQNGRFACVNIADGSVRWELPLEASSSDVAACDIDGDGRAEFVFGTSHGKLYAVGDADGTPRVPWTMPHHTGLGAPMLADVNADGASEIIVTSADGYVNILGSR